MINLISIRVRNKFLENTSLSNVCDRVSGPKGTQSNNSSLSQAPLSVKKNKSEDFKGEIIKDKS